MTRIDQKIPPMVLFLPIRGQYYADSKTFPGWTLVDDIKRATIFTDYIKLWEARTVVGQAGHISELKL